MYVDVFVDVTPLRKLCLCLDVNTNTKYKYPTKVRVQLKRVQEGVLD